MSRTLERRLRLPLHDPVEVSLVGRDLPEPHLVSDLGGEPRSLVQVIALSHAVRAPGGHEQAPLLG